MPTCPYCEKYIPESELGAPCEKDPSRAWLSVGLIGKKNVESSEISDSIIVVCGIGESIDKNVL